MTRDLGSRIIQARWRGVLTRMQFARMKEEVLWPIKGWFEFTGLGANSTRVEVQFFANPRFNEFKHFQAFGVKHRRHHRSETRVKSRVRPSSKVKVKAMPIESGE